MWRIPNFFCEVLTRPMFIMLAIFPHFGIGNIIDYSFVSHPNLRFVLAVSERKLLLTIQFHLEKFKLCIDPPFRDFSGLRHLIIFITTGNDADPFKFSLCGLGYFHPPFFTKFTFEKYDG